MKSIPFLSVIIGTYNRPELLANCLDSLLMQTTEMSIREILVVDGSTDDATRRLVAEYSRRSSSVRYIYEEKPGHSNARNRGYHESMGEYLIYLDDDAIASADYLENVHKVTREYAPDIMGGPVYPYYTIPKPRWFQDEFETRKYEEQSGFSTRCLVSGGNFIIRKSVLAGLGLFDPNYGIIEGRLNMLDDAKVLTLYRAHTPVERQRVYYSLEAYIKHYTPKEKMRLSYILRRRYMTGLMAFRMYLEVDGRPDHRRGIKLFRKVPITSAKFIRDIFKKGFFKVDYAGFFINILMTVVWSCGYLLAQLQYLINKKLFHKIQP